MQNEAVEISLEYTEYGKEYSSKIQIEEEIQTMIAAEEIRTKSDECYAAVFAFLS